MTEGKHTLVPAASSPLPPGGGGTTIPTTGTTTAITISDKVYLIVLRFLSIASFAASVFACFAAHHKITVNEHPYVNHIFDIQCTDLKASGDSREYCETSLMTRYYTLWRTFDSFFSLSDWDGGVLCGKRDFPVPVDNNPDIASMTVDNLGNCSESTAIAIMVLSILTLICCASLVIYITVFAGSSTIKTSATSFRGAGAISVLSMATSTAAIVLYLTSIDPLRLDVTFCEKQTLFSHCQQDMGDGFWFQVATLVMVSLAFAVILIWETIHACHGGGGTTGIQQQQQQHTNKHHPPFYASLHFYVQMVRFSELAILIFGLVYPFTKVQTTIPARPSSIITQQQDGTANSTSLLDHAFAGHGGTMYTEITLWQGLFCKPFGARLFLWSVVLDELDGGGVGGVEASKEATEEEHETFGQCDHGDLFECQMGYIMAMVTAITAMTFQKDAKDMPLPYMVGFVMHFLSMVKISWALGKFMTSVFPGRKAIDPSYCSLWTSYVGENSTCSIEIGIGFILTCAALATVFISFVGELVVQSNEEYGVGTAYRTLMGRVRQGRITDLLKPSGTSQRELDVGEDNIDDKENPPQNENYSKLNSNVKEGRLIVVNGETLVVVNASDSRAGQPSAGMSALMIWGVVMMLVAVVLVILFIFVILMANEASK